LFKPNKNSSGKGEKFLRKMELILKRMKKKNEKNQHSTTNLSSGTVCRVSYNSNMSINDFYLLGKLGI
jgi:hypothetical protein